MDDTEWNRLWQDLHGHVRRLSRYYARGGDREDAEQEACAWLCRLPPHLPQAEYVATARSAIRSIGRQADRREAHEMSFADIGDTAI